jgi:2-polyprenyl-6-hydroxyphenyl methylase/3-demethylubiquinone-9 3-methyltransferase
MNENLKRLDSHFAFGENWADFAKSLDSEAISHAEAGLAKLLDAHDIAGKSFLDIGCGSGVHALAALRFGAARVMGVDIDPNSVAAAKGVLNRFAAEGPWSIEALSVFKLDPARLGVFDIVYSWGVLHHTGDMFGAIGHAANMVRPGGLFAIALYRPTTLDPFWVAEKRWYSGASNGTQAAARSIYMAALRAGHLVKGRSFARFRDSYVSRRGMSLDHDVHDWLGGYPYESIGADELADHMAGLGFEEVKRFARGKDLGLLGSGCDEFVYRRQIA